MRIHTSLTAKDIHTILKAQKNAGRIGDTVDFAVFESHNSRTHDRAFEVQLASSTCESFIPAGLKEFATTQGAPKVALSRASRRRARNNNVSAHATHNYAPSWHEWGHFIAGIFDADSSAKVGSYNDIDSFIYQTGTQFRSPREIDYAIEWNLRAYDFIDDLAV